MREHVQCRELSVTYNYLKSFDFSFGCMLALRQLVQPGDVPRCPVSFLPLAEGLMSHCLWYRQTPPAWLRQKLWG